MKDEMKGDPIPKDRRFKIYNIKTLQLGQEIPIAGNCIQVRAALGTLTITTDKGDQDIYVQGETGRYDNGFKSLKIVSSVGGDNPILSIGYGLKFFPFTAIIGGPLTVLGQWLYGAVINLGITFPFLGGFLNRFGGTQGVFQSDDMIALDVMQQWFQQDDILPISVGPWSVQLNFNAHKKFVFQINGLAPGDTMSVESAVNFATLNVLFKDLTVIDRSTGNPVAAGNIIQDGIYEANVEGYNSVFLTGPSLAAPVTLKSFSTRA